MKPEDFEFLSELVKEKTGLVLTQEKSYLLESRLMPLARKRGMKDLDGLVQVARLGKDLELNHDIAEAMTTNESFFFRDIKPFDIFRDVLLPYLLDARKTQKSIRVWCAACSSGQEPYSLAMILKEAAAKLGGWKVDILGTDVSREILEKAQEGNYSQFEVQRGLPVQMLVKYFKKSGESWQIDQSIRDMVVYKEFNLLSDLKSLGKFDIVFCRNVLIYFDRQTKGAVLEQISNLLPNDGSLS